MTEWHWTQLTSAENQRNSELAVRLHQTKEDIPKNGIIIDATAALARVVDEILRLSNENKPLYPTKAKRVGAAILAQSKSTTRKPRSS